MPTHTRRIMMGLILTALLPIVAAGCSTDSSFPGVPCVQYVPDSGSGTLSTQLGSSSTCSIVAVDVMVTGVSDLFAADFTIEFDGDKFRYAGGTDNGSILASGGAATIGVFPDPLDVENTTTPGTVEIGITRSPGLSCDQAGQPTCEVNVTGTELLLTLFFRTIADPGSSSALAIVDAELVDGGDPDAVPPVLPQPIPPVPATADGGTLSI